jgi:hypothetical protein
MKGRRGKKEEKKEKKRKKRKKKEKVVGARRLLQYFKFPDTIFSRYSEVYS